MEEKSNLERLQDFAKQTGRQIFFKEEQYPLPPYRKFPRYRRTAYIPYDEEKNLFLVFFGDPYHKIMDYTIFCGAYLKINASQNSKLNFREKNIIDKLNPFSKGGMLKMGNRQFDSKVITTGNDSSLLNRVFKNAKLQRYMMEALQSKMFLNFSLNETNVDFVPELAGHSHLALINPQEWVLDANTLESWLRSMARIKTILQNKEVVQAMY